jgi:hypothetical protein
MGLEQQRSTPIHDNGHKEYEDLDQLRYKWAVEAVRKCRKLHLGKVGFPRTIQLAMRQNRTWSFLVKKKKGLQL